MATLDIEGSSDRYIVEKKDGQPINFFHLKEIDRGLLKKILKDPATKKQILVDLFLNDTNERTIEEVANDLGIDADKTRMMRYQFRTEGRMPYSKRVEILSNFYLKGL